MASTPDSHPDSIPTSQPGSIEQTDADFDGRSRRGDDGGVNDLADSPGSPAGTAGTGGDNKAQDDLDR